MIKSKKIGVRFMTIQDIYAKELKIYNIQNQIEKLNQKKQSLNNVTIFGKGAQDGGHALDRRIQHHEEDSANK